MIMGKDGNLVPDVKTGRHQVGRIEFAYPVPTTTHKGASVDEHAVLPGVTVRDYFAGKAVTSIASVWFTGEELSSASEGKVDAMMVLAARLAYRLADAMMAERAK